MADKERNRIQKDYERWYQLLSARDWDKETANLGKLYNQIYKKMKKQTKTYYKR